MIIFPYGQYIVGNVFSLAFRGIVKFEIDVEIAEKYAKM